MTKKKMNKSINQSLPFLLALHSSSETFGVAFVDCRDPKQTRQSSTFPIGRNLSNKIFTCVEEILPSNKWKKLSRIAVSTGPGGFTGTRLSVVMARTLCEQIGCPLDGISSFQLMAPRLIRSLTNLEKDHPFWIIQETNRRGNIGGKYQINNDAQKSHPCIKEIIKPHILESNFNEKPTLFTQEDVNEDVNELLRLCEKRFQSNQESSWMNVAPIYPTSPVENH